MPRGGVLIPAGIKDHDNFVHLMLLKAEPSLSLRNQLSQAHLVFSKTLNIALTLCPTSRI